MSLEDKFYPDDGSRLTRFDNCMIKTAGKLGGLYQNLTGKSYKNLVKTSYKIAVGGFGLSLIGLRAMSVFFGAYSLSGLLWPDYTSPLEEELRNEATGQHRKLGKVARACGLAIIPIAFFSSYCLLDSKSGKASSVLKYVEMGGIVEGLSLIPFNFAEYLTKAEMPNPPEKGWVKETKEKVKEFLKPQPVLFPEPIKILDKY